jgi:hypothetical protein
VSAPTPAAPSGRGGTGGVTASGHGAIACATTTATSIGPSQPAEGPAQQFTGAIAFHVDSTGITELGRISHPTINGYAPQIERSIVIANQLYTVSSEGILASDLDTLAPCAFAAFPATPQPPRPVTVAPPPAVR